MKHENKKTLWKVAKIFWLILGILLIASTIILFALLPLSGNFGELILLIAFLVYSIYALTIYIVITIVYFIIKFIMRLFRKKKK